MANINKGKTDRDSWCLNLDHLCALVTHVLDQWLLV